MTKTGNTPHEQKIDALTSDFAKKGYDVVVKPKPAELPADLAGYHPDMIAKRGTEVVVVEIKSSTERLPVERYKSIAERIAAHDGWRFVLVTLDETGMIEPPSVSSQLLDWAELQRGLQIVESLVQQGLLEPAVVYLWGIVEAALRRRAEVIRVPVERFPSHRLLDQLYSFGEVSVHELDDLQAMFKTRNRVAHGVTTAIDPESFKKGLAAVQSLVTKWANDRT